MSFYFGVFVGVIATDILLLIWLYNEIIEADKETIKEAINILKICKKTLYMIDNKTFYEAEMVTVMVALDNVVTDLEDIIKE